MDEQQQPQETTRTWTVEDRKVFGWTLASTAGLGEAINLIAHGGWLGAGAAAAAAVILAKSSPDLYESVKDVLPWHDAQQAITHALTSHDQGKRSILDRALGRHYDDAPEDQDVDEDTRDVASMGEDEPVIDPIEARYQLQHAHNWTPDVREIAGKSQFVCGFRRSGKTSYGALLAEQLASKDLPFFIPDLEGDYLTLADRAICGRSILAGNDAGGPQYARVTAENAEQFGAFIIKKRVQVVLDMQSYRDIDIACRIVAAIIRGMIDFTSEHPEYRVPCAVYLDEAQRFLPEQMNASIISDSAVKGEFLKAYNDVIAVGGKRGLYPVILTQRISQVKKSIMAQPEIMVLMKQVMDIDLDRYDSFINRVIATHEQIKAFPQGRGVVITPEGEQFLVQFNRRKSKHNGGTPTVDAVYALPLDDDDMRPLIEPAHNDAHGRTTARPEPNLTLVRAEALQGVQDEYAQENSVRQPVERTHTPQMDASYPRLNDTQIVIFKATYETTGNIDKSLKASNADTRYRQHARVIIAELGLKKREA